MFTSHHANINNLNCHNMTIIKQSSGRSSMRSGPTWIMVSRKGVQFSLLLTRVLRHSEKLRFACYPVNKQTLHKYNQAIYSAKIKDKGYDIQCKDITGQDRFQAEERTVQLPDYRRDKTVPESGGRCFQTYLKPGQTLLLKYHTTSIPHNVCDGFWELWFLVDNGPNCIQ